ncbi:hypothetical protein CEP52_017263 [Fusarium oligoseptatum]|uniref:Uncharacterized protein n=1 Tax=Fusarium oligoseptatum TaxID=2604345 RepID=A0A428RU78_9HYPO|nr:hypothetical protein CEP52_017263 [Fusarium oligoseptatum]
MPAIEIKEPVLHQAIDPAVGISKKYAQHWIIRYEELTLATQQRADKTASMASQYNGSKYKLDLVRLVTSVI